MTLRECSVVVSGHQKRAQERQNLAYYQAFMTGVFSQPYAKGKFPKYGTHAPWKAKRKPRERQDWQTQQSLVKALNAAFGGEFRERGD